VKAGHPGGQESEEIVIRFMTMVKFDESLPMGTPPAELFEVMSEFAAEGARNVHAD
jgi:hypothetical protein